jgi:hypothetical protein
MEICSRDFNVSCCRISPHYAALALVTPAMETLPTHSLLCGSELHRDLKPVQGLLAGDAVDATQCPPER